MLLPHSSSAVVPGHIGKRALSGGMDGGIAEEMKSNLLKFIGYYRNIADTHPPFGTRFGGVAEEGPAGERRLPIVSVRSDRGDRLSAR